jgi:hypothetical protein
MIAMYVFLANAWAGTLPNSQSSAFLPLPGQVVHYGFSDTFITPKGTRNSVGTLTLRNAVDNQIHVTVAFDGKGTRDFDFSVDGTGALQFAVSLEQALSLSKKSRGKGTIDPSLTEQALISRLSLAARLSAQPGEEMSFPILLDVPWASGPVNPILRVTSAEPNMIAGDAKDSTIINPPQNGRPHVFRSLALSAGVGILAGQIGGTTGRVIGPVFTVSSLLYVIIHRPGPLPTDIALHTDGQFADGRLKALSCDEEFVVHVKKHPRTISDKWTLTAE